MADYESPTIIQPSIPQTSITPLERLLLYNMFQSELDGDKVYFFAKKWIEDLIELNLNELRRAYAESVDLGGQAVAFTAKALAAARPDDVTITLDMTETSWEFFFQDIIAREPGLKYVKALSAWTCSKMKPDGFGGMAVLITAERILGKSTDDVINDFLDEVDPDGKFEEAADEHS